MKKFLLLFGVILSLISAKAADWDDFEDVNRMWDAQKTITNQEFEQVMDALEEKKNLKEEKKQKKRFKKISGGGTSLHNELVPDKEIAELDSFKSKEDGVLINSPVTLFIDGKPLEKGFYKLVTEKNENGKCYINFYQSQFFKGKLLVTETKDDFNKETIDFAEIIPYNESFVKFIFGSLDFNAYAYIPYIE